VRASPATTIDRARAAQARTRASGQPRAQTPDPTRARHPDATGVIERDGVRVAWERYGTGSPTILLLPTWSIIHSRFWKAQIPYLSRHFRVVTFDGRGNGRSDRPARTDHYTTEAFADDALAVLDATATSTAVIVSLSMGARWGLVLAARHSERVSGAVFIGPSVSLASRSASREAAIAAFEARLPVHEGWDKYNRHYWRREYPDFLEFFFGECFSEPHSTKPIEDCVGWGLETDPETLLLIEDAKGLGEGGATEALARAVGCPVLVLHGSDDRVIPLAVGERLAALTRGRLVVLEGSGHIPLAREPVLVNLAIRDFVRSLGEHAS
jgi:pimeloyl-ACP methyl ester carboxylesterase